MNRWWTGGYVVENAVQSAQNAVADAQRAMTSMGFGGFGGVPPVVGQAWASTMWILKPPPQRVSW